MNPETSHAEPGLTHPIVTERVTVPCNRLTHSSMPAGMFQLEFMFGESNHEAHARGRGLLQLWQQNSAGVTEGWIFPSRSGKPLNMDEFPRRVIEPLLEGKGIEWKGLSAARRGAATILTELAKNRGLAAMGLHGHKSLGTTQDHYILAVPEETLRALRLLEAATSFKAGL